LYLSAFILAAGIAERLRPVTDHIPKPLLPVLGKPILQSILEKLSTLPINNIGINLHHKKELIEDWIKQSSFQKSVDLFPEDPVLGTGGALKNAEEFFKNGPFLVHNSDIFSDIDLGKLIDFHLSSKNFATLAVHDYQEFNNLETDKEGFLKSISKTSKPNYAAFTGVAVYQPDFLRFLPAGISSIIDAWLKAISFGYKIGTFDITGCYWNDIGTPASYAKAVINELRKNGEMVYVHTSFDGCTGIEMNGYVVIEKDCKINKGASIRNCTMLPGTMIGNGEEENNPDAHPSARDNPPTPSLAKGAMGGWKYENCILGPGFKIDLRDSDLFNADESISGIIVGTGGSDRKYYRIRRNEQSLMLMQCNENDTDFLRHIEYTKFFQKYSIPVPQLIESRPEKMVVYFEDLGDLSLYSWLKCPREPEEIEAIYKKAIDILSILHILATKYVSECRFLQNRIFDYEYLRWETSYFLERFIGGIRNITVKNLSVLNDEFHRLAVSVNSFPKAIIHRDFQSQNIMITKGGILRLLDYQGARMGPPAYDVVSLLWDPYYCLEEGLRERLLDYYINKVISSNIFSSQFNNTILPCRLQRHMQALGAYGFLSTVKGKQYFQKFIPEGLRLLKEDVTLSKDEYPELYKLVMRL
jgi:NDP-sugar pyrophosphorylase family protein/aminoglycoside/choline kinase family phosphotransferase